MSTCPSVLLVVWFDDPVPYDRCARSRDIKDAQPLSDHEATDLATARADTSVVQVGRDLPLDDAYWGLTGARTKHQSPSKSVSINWKCVHTLILARISSPKRRASMNA